MPAIQVLGCCSRLGTWSTACRRAGFLQLSSKTCRDGASRFLRAASSAGPAEDAAGITQRASRSLCRRGWPRWQVCTAAWQLPASCLCCPEESWGADMCFVAWSGDRVLGVVVLRGDSACDLSINPAIALWRKPGICRICRRLLSSRGKGE